MNCPFCKATEAEVTQVEVRATYVLRTRKCPDDACEFIFRTREIPMKSTHRFETLDRIFGAACTHFGISAEHLLSGSRERHVVYSRRVAIYVARQRTQMSMMAISTAFRVQTRATWIAVNAVSKSSVMLQDANAIIELLKEDRL